MIPIRRRKILYPISAFCLIFFLVGVINFIYIYNMVFTVVCNSSPNWLVIMEINIKKY